MLTYRKDLLAAKGLTMPEHPTWQQVADIAAKLDDKKAGMAGICLRGLKGWGEMFAPLTTVVNTYGGTWFDQSWNAQVNSPEFTQAVSFYTDLVKKYGEPDPQTSGFVECQNAGRPGQGGDVVRRDVRRGQTGGPVTEQGCRQARLRRSPRSDKTKYSGWLWSWDWAMPSTTKKSDSAWQFISWASSKEVREPGRHQARLVARSGR